MGEVTKYPNGTFCWVDLGTTDVAGAKAFYQALFGWEAEDVPARAAGTYAVCRLRGRDVAGIHHHGEEEGTAWGSSIAVDDVDAATARARELGATVLTEPTDLPGVAREAPIADPAGAAFTVTAAPGGAFRGVEGS